MKASDGSSAVANPDGPRDWHRQIDELQDKLRAVEIDRNQLHSKLTRLVDEMNCKTFDEAMALIAGLRRFRAEENR